MSNRPNVIVIMSDSFRPDFIGAYGSTWVKTPNLDRLASASAVFTKAYAEFPVTVPARTAIVTGDYTFANRPWIPLKPEDVSIAQVASENGYHTVAFSDSPMHPNANLDKGFAEFNWLPGGKVMPILNPEREPWPDDVEWVETSSDDDRGVYDRTARNRAEYMARHGEYFPEYLAHRVVDWVQTAPREPFFLWVDFFDPHEPWDPPSPYREMYDPDGNTPRLAMPPGPDASFLTPERRRRLLAQYAGCCTQTDAAIGEVLDAIRAQGLFEDSIVVFISDHGEPFGEHGVVRKYHPVLYDELARIALMIHAPGYRTGVVPALAQNVDLAPTLCSLLGWEKAIPPPNLGKPGTRFDGEDLLPILRGDLDEVRTRAWLGAFGMRSGVRTSRHKLIDNQGQRPNELYDLDSDPGETTNLIDAEAELARELAYELWKFRGTWGIPFTWRDGPPDVHDLSAARR